MEKTYSFSAISSYLQCSLKYYFQYVLKIRFKEISPAIHLGSVCHEIFEYHYKNNCETSLEHLKERFLETFDFGLLEGNIVEKFPKQIYYNRLAGLRIIENFYNEKTISKISPLVYYDENGVESEAIEMYFRLPIIDLNTGEVLVDNVSLTGVIDVAEARKNKIHVRDHKTSSSEYTSFFIETSIQLAAYAYAIRYLAGMGKIKSKAKKESSVGFNLFMKTKDKDYVSVVERTIEEEDINTLTSIVSKIHKAVENKIFIPANNSACDAYGGCEYRGICLLYQKNKKPFEKGILTDTQFLIDMHNGLVEVGKKE